MNMRYKLNNIILALAGLLVVALVAVPITAADKTTSGIYLTAEDYQNGKLSFEAAAGSPHKLELHDVSDKPYIHVTHGNETQAFEKSQLYGFRDSEGRSYRFVRNQEYQILEAKELYIYSVGSAQDLKSRAAIATAPGYHFSVGASGTALRLTRDNLKKAFPDAHRFHSSLDRTFKGDSELSQYDKSRKTFTVNRLLSESER
jgi:hypothetical protein